MDKLVSNEIRRLEDAFDKIERETPFLKPIANAFKEVMISRAIVKARLSGGPAIHIAPPEPARFAAGHPWLTEQTLASLIDPWGENVESTMAPLVKAFPSVAAEVVRARDAFKGHQVDLKHCISALVEGGEEGIIKIASVLGMQPLILKFILGQMLKPFVERRTENLRPVIADLPWYEGYCPICGSYPELSFLRGNEGQRWLRCSLCGHTWRFDRMTCPYCGERKESREFVCVDGSDHKWAELCDDCHRYVVGIDLRKQVGISEDVAAISMVHLDIIAQQMGFFPTAECAWNMVPPSN